MNTLIPLEIFTTLFLTGLIWVIQLVHYPSFYFIERNRFVEFENFHTRSIGFIVAPLMVIELLVGICLCIINPDSLNLIKLGVVCGVWLVTFLLSVPIHSRLSLKFSAKEVSRLIKTNWARTILWSIKSTIVLSSLIN